VFFYQCRSAFGNKKKHNATLNSNSIIKKLHLIQVSIFILLFSFNSIFASIYNKEDNCNLNAPTTTLDKTVIDVNSQLSGDVNFSPANTTIDILLVTNKTRHSRPTYTKGF